MTITIDSLISLKSYSACRGQFQPGLIAYRRRRTVTLGEHMCIQFEDEMTLRYQIQEMLRAERIEDRMAIQHEIDAYAHLMPDGASLKATLLIECPDPLRRMRELPGLARAARHVYIEFAGLPCCFAHANEDIGDADERLSAVHFLRFPLSREARNALRSGAPARLGCAYACHAQSVAIAAHTLDSLRSDLARADSGRGPDSFHASVVADELPA